MRPYGDSYRWLIGAYENVVGEVYNPIQGSASIGAMESLYIGTLHF